MDVGNENKPARDPDSYYHLPAGSDADDLISFVILSKQAHLFW
jgi:hypothetical protein